MSNSIYGPRNFEAGKKAAFSFGAEFQANPEESRKEYLDSFAFYFREDVEYFKDLTQKEKDAGLIEFRKGIDAEKRYQ